MSRHRLVSSLAVHRSAANTTSRVPSTFVKAKWVVSRNEHLAPKLSVFWGELFLCVCLCVCLERETENMSKSAKCQPHAPLWFNYCIIMKQLFIPTAAFLIRQVLNNVLTFSQRELRLRLLKKHHRAARSLQLFQNYRCTTLTVCYSMFLIISLKSKKLGWLFLLLEWAHIRIFGCTFSSFHLTGPSHNPNFNLSLLITDPKRHDKVTLWEEFDISLIFFRSQGPKTLKALLQLCLIHCWTLLMVHRPLIACGLFSGYKKPSSDSRRSRLAQRGLQTSKLVIW